MIVREINDSAGKTIACLLISKGTLNSKENKIIYEILSEGVDLFATSEKNKEDMYSTRVWRHLFPIPCSAGDAAPKRKIVVLNYLQYLSLKPIGMSIFMV
jgi:hypothetical protein